MTRVNKGSVQSGSESWGSTTSWFGLEYLLVYFAITAVNVGETVAKFLLHSCCNGCVCTYLENEGSTVQSSERKYSQLCKVNEAQDSPSCGKQLDYYPTPGALKPFWWICHSNSCTTNFDPFPLKFQGIRGFSPSIKICTWFYFTLRVASSGSFPTPKRCIFQKFDNFDAEGRETLTSWAYPHLPKGNGSRSTTHALASN